MVSHGLNVNEMVWSFTLNCLVIFLVISLFISFLSKERSFHFYTLFVFFLTLYTITKSPFESSILQQYANSDYLHFNYFLHFLYNLSFLGFICTFVNLDVNNAKLKSFILNTGIFTMIGFTSLFIFSILIQNQQLFVNSYLFIFIPGFLSLSFYVLYKISFLKERLKYFIFAGSTSYFLSAFYTVYLFLYANNVPFLQNSIDPLTIGLFTASLIFSVGLAYKINRIKTLEIAAQRKLIRLQNHEKVIKEDHQKRLERKLKLTEIELLKVFKAREKEKIEFVTASYESRLSLTQLKTLSNEMNPHFIFNALNSIKSYIIINDQKNAAYYLNQFAKFVRLTLESLPEDYTTLQKDLDILKIYLNLENMRFGYSIDFQFNVSSDITTEEIRIPALILHPFVENALIHGLLPKSGEKKLSIDVFKKEDDVIITIIDNGVGREVSKLHRSNKFVVKKPIGLRIINARLNIYNKQPDFSMTYDIEDLKQEETVLGTKVTLVISGVVTPVFESKELSNTEFF